MSASPQNGIVYDVRLSLNKLSSDLKQQEAMAKASAEKVRAAAEATFSKAVQAEVQFKASATQPMPGGGGIIPPPGGGGGEEEGAAAGSGVAGALKGASKISAAFKSIGKAAGGIMAGIHGIEVGLSGVHLIAAAISGDFEKQTAAAEEARSTISSIPIFGSKILKLGEFINSITIEQVTHEQKYVAELKKATEEQEKQTKSLTEQLKKREEFTKKFGSFAEGLQGKAESQRGTEEERAQSDLAKKRKELADFMADPKSRDNKGQLTETAKVYVAQAQASIAELQTAADFAIVKSKAKAASELAALKAENSGDADAAAYIRLKQERLDAELVAEKKSAEELEIAKQITKEMFAKLDIERTKRIEKEKAEIAKEAQRSAEKEKEDAAKEEQQRMKETERAMKDRRKAELEGIADSLEAQIRGSRDVRGEAISGASALMTNFGGGQSNEQLEELRQQTITLKAIREELRGGVAAVTT